MARPIGRAIWIRSAMTACGADASSALRRLVLDHDFLLGFRRLGLRRAAARALGERGLDLFDRLRLGHALHRCDLAREPVERRLIELAFGVGLLRWRVLPIEIAFDLG